MKRTCEGKVRYETRLEAIEFIKAKQNDNRKGRSKAQVSKAYLCLVCDGYHLYTEGKKPFVGLKSAPKDVNTIAKLNRQGNARHAFLKIVNYTSQPIENDLRNAHPYARGK